MTQQRVAGIFHDRRAMERAIDDLKNAGFDPHHIGVVMRDRQETEAIAEDMDVHANAAAITGSILGGTTGALLAATGAFVIPGIGPFISGGILATSLAGGALGWLVGGLVGLGIPQDEAQYYQNLVEQGDTLLVVDAQGRPAEAQRVLLHAGAEDQRARGFGYNGEQSTSPEIAYERSEEHDDTNTRRNLL